MRILLISPTQSGIGGTAQHIQALIKFLEQGGHYVETISSENTPIIRISGLKNLSFLLTAAVRALFKRDFDVVNAHHAASALAMRAAPGRRVLSTHNTLSDFLTSQMPRHKPGRQFLLTHRILLNAIIRRFERMAMGWADVVTAVSLNGCRYCERMSSGTGPVDIRHVPNGVDTHMSVSADRRYDKQVIFVGRLAIGKGTDNLVAIAGQLPPDVNLLILGAGPEGDKIRALAESHENVHHLGYVENRKAVALIRGSDVLLQPSISDETSSSILEAMACGTAVVASDLNGMREMITSGESGILVDPGDHPGFVAAVSRLLEDGVERDRMSKGAAEAVKRYGWDVVGRKYVDLYESLL